MKHLVAAGALIGTLAVPGLARANGSTDAALGLGAFAVFNQIISGTGVFGRPTVVHGPPPPVVYAPPPAVVYAPPPRPVVVYRSPAVVYAPPRAYYYAPYGHHGYWRHHDYGRHWRRHHHWHRHHD
jgi:hypothetical protein